MISFVILNYNNCEDTLECLLHLIRISKNKEVSFIVVDNNTLTKSEENKIKKYTSDIIKLDKNYGFAKANNLGINYALRKYDSDFVCVLNNDVFISQPNFIEVIYSDYKKYDFDMLGPKIESPSNESVNPFPVLKNKKQVEKELRKSKQLSVIYSNAFLNFFLELYILLKHMIFEIISPKNGDKVMFNVSLHGCTIIFSRKYLDKYQEAFDSRTFLFHEEEFIYQRMIKDKLISVYDPTLIIYHKEGSSIRKTSKKIRLSKLFREKEKIKSLNILLSDMNGVQDGKTKNISNYTSL
jgi:GT2 family glycosyltransferase